LVSFWYPPIFCSFEKVPLPPLITKLAKTSS
jgi:hypothetical protein